MSISLSLKTQEIRPAWLPFLIIAAAVLALAAVYLFPSSWEFPMDDTYIHFVYAQNLAERGQLFFNTPGEVGVGTTSLNWVLLLAGASRLGIPLHLSAKIMGLLALIAAGYGLYLLARIVLKPLPALAFALLVTCSGHLLWFALSGMETVFFLALGVWALLLYHRQRRVGLGILLGLLALTRPDGLALAAAITAVETGLMLYHRSPGQRWKVIIALLVCALICAPWFGYLLWRTGHILPTSAIGKQVYNSIGLRVILSRSPALAILAQFPALIYSGTWVIYLLEFALGGMSLPGPMVQIGGPVGNASYAVSYLGMLGWIVIVLPLLVSFALWLRGFLQHRQFLAAPYRTFLVFSTWIILHNLAYGFFLPIPGTASRYGTINHVALWLALLIGLLRFAPRPNLFRGLAAGLTLIACANTLYWNQVYDANLDHMQNVRLAAANYVLASIPPSGQCAAYDVGVVRFYSGRPIIDLGGLIDPALGDIFRADGRIDRYLIERGVTCAIIPGQTGTTEQGWFDFAAGMGLTTSPYFTIRQEKVFAIDRERWLLGYLPTNNYQATVTIYRVEKR